jgi:RNA polymerase sigma factor for flagellar operon FliA
MDSASLWKAFASGDAAARQALLQENLSLVHHVARQLSRALAAPADFDELVSCGTIGLMNALDAFDASRGHAFSTFAVPRIRGAILDELRRQDHVPRSIRKKTRDISAARETLTRIFGRPATDKELAEHLGIDLPTLWR